jgi:hypothetical protein
VKLKEGDQRFDWFIEQRQQVFQPTAARQPDRMATVVVIDMEPVWRYRQPWGWV